MDWKQKLQSVRQSAEDKLDQKTQIAIEENWPKVQQAFQEKVGPAALAAAQNDAAMETLFKLVYVALPFPIQMVVKQDAFVKFCFSNRDRLLPSGETAAGAA